MRGLGPGRKTRERNPQVLIIIAAVIVASTGTMGFVAVARLRDRRGSDGFRSLCAGD